MKRHEHVTGFYLETLLLIAVFIGVILVLTRVFGVSRALSGEAKLLTNAVCLAQNAAEAASAAGSEEGLLALLDEGGNAVTENGAVRAAYDADMRPDRAGRLVVYVTWEPAAEDYVESSIRVLYEGREEPVYTLETGVFLGEVSP